MMIQFALSKSKFKVTRWHSNNIV